MPARRAALSLALLVAALFAVVRSPARDAQVTAFVGATVVHPESGAAERDRTVIVRGERIDRIGPSSELEPPPGANVVDARGKWLIPGLVDSHVHVFQSGNPYTRPDVLDLRARVPYEAEDRRNRARLPMTLRTWLACGVTSIADLGGPMWTFEARSFAERTAAAPRLAVAGPLISTVARPELDLGDPPIVRAASPEDAAALARTVLASRPDFLKVWFIHRPGDDLDRQEALVRAVADEAHRAGVLLVVHATELRVAKAALRAGADILAHSISDELVDDELLDLARRRGAIYVTTLFVGEGYDLALSGAWEPTDEERRLADPEVVAAMRDLDELAPGIGASGASPSRAAVLNVRRVWDAGVPVALGSDAGNIGTLHGPGFFREVRELARAGLTPREILIAATTNGAKVMGLAGAIGEIRPGALADLVLLDADPLESAENLQRASRVMKAGRLFDPAELAAPRR